MARPFTPSPAFPAARAEYDRLCAVAADASAALRSIPGVGTGGMGLTPDAVKFGAPYRAAAARYDAAAAALRSFTPGYLRTFKREVTAEREARRAAIAERNRLAAEYVRRIGYDPFADDPAITVAEVARILAEHREESERANA